MNVAAFIVAIVAALASGAAVLFARKAANASQASAEEARKARLETSGPFVTAVRPVPLSS
jgi:Flp pilus assembly protein CpaB